jgi:hypothetical protein
VSNNSKPLPEHWTTTELRGAPGAFQRAATASALMFGGVALWCFAYWVTQ